MKDRLRFYEMSLGSIRECQAIFDLLEVQDSNTLDRLDHLAATTYKLCNALKVGLRRR